MKIQILLTFLCSSCLFLEEGKEEQEIIPQEIEQCIINGNEINNIEGFNNALVALGPNYTNHGLCSGILVAPQLVLTAGHCGIGESSVVRFGVDTRNPTEEIKATMRIRHPNYPNPDLAFWVLKRPPITAKPYAKFGKAYVENYVTLFSFGSAKQEVKGPLRQADGFIVSEIIGDDTLTNSHNNTHLISFCENMMGEGGDSGAPFFNEYGEIISIYTHSLYGNNTFLYARSQIIYLEMEWINNVITSVIGEIIPQKRINAK